MSVIHPQDPQTAAPEQSTGVAAMRLPARTLDYLFAVTRLSLGWVFLWPFLDKMFGLGHETPAAKAWINGGSPTKGFLSGAVGPFGGFYQSFAGATWANWGFHARTDLHRRRPAVGCRHAHRLRRGCRPDRVDVECVPSPLG